MYSEYIHSPSHHFTNLVYTYPVFNQKFFDHKVSDDGLLFCLKDGWG